MIPGQTPREPLYLVIPSFCLTSSDLFSDTLASSSMTQTGMSRQWAQPCQGETAPGAALNFSVWSTLFLSLFLSWQHHTCLHPHELKENELVTKLYIGDDPTFKETRELLCEEKQLVTSQISWHRET